MVIPSALLAACMLEVAFLSTSSHTLLKDGFNGLVFHRLVMSLCYNEWRHALQASRHILLYVCFCGYPHGIRDNMLRQILDHFSLRLCGASATLMFGLFVWTMCKVLEWAFPFSAPMPQRVP